MRLGVGRLTYPDILEISSLKVQSTRGGDRSRSLDFLARAVLFLRWWRVYTWKCMIRGEGRSGGFLFVDIFRGALYIWLLICILGVMTSVTYAITIMAPFTKSREVVPVLRDSIQGEEIHSLHTYGIPHLG